MAVSMCSGATKTKPLKKMKIITLQTEDQLIDMYAFEHFKSQSNNNHIEKIHTCENYSHFAVFENAGKTPVKVYELTKKV